MKKIVSSFLAFALSALMFAAAVPAFAAQPTVESCSFIVIAATNTAPGTIWYSGVDDSILHVRGRESTATIFYGSMSLIIGSVTSSTDMDYNLKTGQGNAIRIWTFTFISPVNFPSGTPAGIANPFGLGSISGVATMKTTSLWNSYAPGDATGQFVGTDGTGDFANAKLMAQLEADPYTAGGRTVLRADFTGELTFHD